MKPRKPAKLKAISGTTKKSRPEPELVDLPLVDDAPEVPDWMPNSHAVNEWNRLAPILTANKLLTKAGCSAFGVMCALQGKIIQLFAAGECPTGHMLAQYRNLVNDFGLTPVAQGKVKSVEPGKKKNPFLKNVKK